MKIIITFLFVFFLFSCKDKYPQGILGREKMKAVYWDIMRADEMVNYQASSDTSYNRVKSQDSLYTAILNIHGITRETFLKSKAYYESHPDLLKPILDSLFIEGERLQNIPEQTEEPTPPAVDSIPAPQRIPRDNLLKKDQLKRND